jgi:Uma2 family endonuclease
MIRKWQPIIAIGPEDHGREIALEDFEHAIGTEGYHYELIDGRIELSPLPDFVHDSFEVLLLGALMKYADLHPDITNYVTTKARVFVPARRRATCPEPDITLYRDVPLDQPPSQVNWRDLSPILVVEVLSPDNADKDLQRNVRFGDGGQGRG